MLDAMSSDTDSISSPISPFNLGPQTAYPLPPSEIPIFPISQSQPEPLGNSSKRKASSQPIAHPEVVHSLLKDQKVKKDRLARKAELARESRKRKKTRLEELERQVSELQTELARSREETKILSAKNLALTLESKCKTTPEVEKSTDKAIEDFLAQVKTNPQCDSSIEQPISEVSLAHKRQINSMETSIRSLEQSLTPCLGLQFLEWALTSERDQFYEEKDGLFLSLFRDQLGASQKQIELLLTLRREMQKEESRKKDQALLESFRALKSNFLVRGVLKQQEIFDRLRSIFTPSQLAAYFQYVKQYGHVLIKVPV
eukprot:TRINITY_DN12570_c0_g1_i7.p1 TRINITY_DN12570_c0_g1~~TRINITY_DN12570_c0_g1_i7.p1  ORF type:complete len:365 (-),score=13.33 TRINITY_DN12570_c0_g1_i7:65-1009(-)